eukprot:6099474-Amphidinium_carterae.1
MPLAAKECIHPPTRVKWLTSAARVATALKHSSEMRIQCTLRMGRPVGLRSIHEPHWQDAESTQAAATRLQEVADVYVIQGRD